MNSPLLVEQASGKLGRVFQKERDKVSQLKAQLIESETKMLSYVRSWIFNRKNKSD